MSLSSTKTTYSKIFSEEKTKKFPGGLVVSIRHFSKQYETKQSKNSIYKQIIETICLILIL